MVRPFVFIKLRPHRPGAHVPLPPERLSTDRAAQPSLAHHLGEGAPERPSEEDVEKEVDEVVREHDELQDGEAHVCVSRKVGLLVWRHVQHVEQVDAVLVDELVENARAGAQREVQGDDEQHHCDLIRRKFTYERHPDGRVTRGRRLRSSRLELRMRQNLLSLPHQPVDDEAVDADDDCGRDNDDETRADDVVVYVHEVVRRSDVHAPSDVALVYEVHVPDEEHRYD